MINVVNLPPVSTSNIEAYANVSKKSHKNENDSNLSMGKFYLMVLACFWIIVLLIAIVFLFIYGISIYLYKIEIELIKSNLYRTLK